MAVYGMVLDKQDSVMQWIADTSRRGKEEGLVKNPFKVRIKFWLRKKEVLLVMSMNSVYFNYTIFGWVAAVASYLLLGFGWWLFPWVVFGCLGVFWSPEFYYWTTRLGLKKAGYTGKFRRLRLKDIIQEVVF